MGLLGSAVKSVAKKVAWAVVLVAGKRIISKLAAKAKTKAGSS